MAQLISRRDAELSLVDDTAREELRERLREKGIHVAERPLARPDRQRVKPASLLQIFLKRLTK
ncbi:MAG: hypothetical protein H0U67_01820 [Gemmatimonadetes bacterium]|nr:hypothetical protein [Gemmatimonadota bacterium]